jgi:hypothetical protein
VTVDATARLARIEATRDLQDALALFDELPAVEVGEMHGAWKGAGVETGNALDGLLEKFGWWGKRFDDPDNAHPLVFEDKRGKFNVNPAGLPIGFVVRNASVLRNGAVATIAKRVLRLRRTNQPRARLRMIEYRGVVTGTMSYDALPINDHFRKIDDNTLLGVMDLRGATTPFVFLLRRKY